MRKIYLASSWRNEGQPVLLDMLRCDGHEVYDFKNPRPNDKGFSWNKDSDGIENYNFLKALDTENAKIHFGFDMEAMEWADTFILYLPCGKSAHLETGWAIGKGKPTCIMLPYRRTPDWELMYLMADKIAGQWFDLKGWLDGLDVND